MHVLFKTSVWPPYVITIGRMPSNELAELVMPRYFGKPPTLLRHVSFAPENRAQCHRTFWALAQTLTTFPDTVMGFLVKRFSIFIPFPRDSCPHLNKHLALWLSLHYSLTRRNTGSQVNRYHFLSIQITQYRRKAQWHALFYATRKLSVELLFVVWKICP